MSERTEKIINPLAVQLKNIEDQIQHIKANQFNGTDTIQTYLNETEDDWDIDLTPGGDIELLASIVFTADSQDAPANALSFEILTDNVNEYKAGSFDSPDSGVAVVTYVHDSFLMYANIPPEPKKDAWFLAIYTFGVTNLKIKFKVNSTDTGVITHSEETMLL